MLQEDYDRLLAQFEANRQELIKLQIANDEMSRELSNVKLDNEVKTNRIKILKSGLEVYADKNFWIRVPAYSLASADKGQTALIALLQAGDEDA